MNKTTIKGICGVHGETDFYKGSRNCIICMKENNAKADVRAYQQARHLRVKYGMTIADKQLMLENQNNLCPICGLPIGMKDGFIDHCHTTGKVRGIIHNKCNIGIGHLNDDPSHLANAINYLTD